MFFIIKVDIKNKDDAESIYNINSFNDQDSLVDKIIARLKRSFPEPERTFKRLGQTNFLSISTLPTETKENMKSWLLTYNIKLNTLKGFTLVTQTQAGANITLTIKFNSMSKPQYEYITDEYFKDEELVESLQYTGVDLSNLNTPENNLNGVIFDELHYIGANFANSHLNEASFNVAHFVAANFSHATLQGANFYDTDLRTANFYDTDLRGANFYDTDLTPYLKADGTLIKSSLNGANLKYADLTKAKLNGADLEGADLRGAVLTGTDFTGCNMQGAKLYGTNWQESLHDANLETDADFDMGYNYIDISTPATIAEKAANIENARRVEAEDRLAPLEIDLLEVIPNSKSQAVKVTYNDIVQLLLPKITNVKMPLSEMEEHKWYGIARLGTTSLDVWKSVGLVGKAPAIGARFKCIQVPAKTMGEAQVYKSGPDCMAIHEIVRGIDIGQVLTTFINIVGKDRLQEVTLADESQLLSKVMQELYQLIVFLLGYHLADEPEDEPLEEPDDEFLEGAWTRYYNTGPENYPQRKKFGKHAIYHKDEGLIHHPFFQSGNYNSTPDNLLIILEFIKMLPLQVQVAWAQHYIQEFIMGYGQTLKNFDPTRISADGFIASCINGNFEKLLMAIRTAIVQMAKAQPPEPETAADQRQTLINAFTQYEFEKYFTQEQDKDGPTIERYKQYMEKNDIIKPKLKAQYLLLFEDPLVIKQLEELISTMSGGVNHKQRVSKQKHKHIRKTRKNSTNKIYKHILKKIKRKTHKKQKQKQKKTHKKPKKTHKTHKKH